MLQKILEIGKSYKIAVMGFLLIFCLLATYYFHFILKIEIIFTHFFYVPIILASLWWPRKGIVVAVFLASLLLVSHALIGCPTIDFDHKKSLLWGFKALFVFLFPLFLDCWTAS